MTIEELRSTYKEIIIFDTEYTTWEGALERNWSLPHEHRELVQISAAVLDLQQKVITDTLNLLLLPRINFVLSSYFCSLTGISQVDVEKDGLDFAVAYEQFINWTGNRDCFSYRKPNNLIGDAEVLIENIALYNESFHIKPSQFKNIRLVFDSAGVPIEQFNSGKLHQYFGIDLTGHEHNAVHDVRSISESLFALL